MNMMEPISTLIEQTSHVESQQCEAFSPNNLAQSAICKNLFRFHPVWSRYHAWILSDRAI